MVARLRVTTLLLAKLDVILSSCLYLVIITINNATYLPEVLRYLTQILDLKSFRLQNIPAQLEDAGFKI